MQLINSCLYAAACCCVAGGAEGEGPPGAPYWPGGPPGGAGEDPGRAWPPGYGAPCVGYGGAWFYFGQHDPVTGVTFKRRLQDDMKQTKQVAIGHWGSTVHKRAVVQGMVAVRDTVVVQDTGLARMVVVQGMVVQVVQVVHRAVPGKASRRRHRADWAGLAV